MAKHLPLCFGDMLSGPDVVKKKRFFVDVLSSIFGHHVGTLGAGVSGKALAFDTPSRGP